MQEDRQRSPPDWRSCGGREAESGSDDLSDVRFDVRGRGVRFGTNGGTHRRACKVVGSPGKKTSSVGSPWGRQGEEGGGLRGLFGGRQLMARELRLVAMCLVYFCCSWGSPELLLDTALCFAVPPAPSTQSSTYPSRLPTEPHPRRTSRRFSQVRCKMLVYHIGLMLRVDVAVCCRLHLSDSQYAGSVPL